MKQFESGEASRILRQQKAYFESGENRDLDFRIQQLNRLKQGIKDNERLLLESLRHDLHKSEYEAFTTEIGLIYQNIGQAVKNLKSWARPRSVKTPFMLLGTRSYVRPEAYGSVLIIGPFNYPMNLVIEPLIGAMAAGNCAVLKPSELTPQVSGSISQIMTETFPENYIRVVEGDRDATAALINQPFDYIFFTGGATVAKIVMAAAAKNLVPVTLELGGKSPCIVDETADIAAAARKIAWGKFSNCGQTCVAPDYVVVHKQVKKAFLDSLRQCLLDFYGSDPQKSPDFGRIVNKREAERLGRLIDRDKIAAGGTCEIESCYIAPTVLDGVNWDDPIMQEEIFGPILPVLEFDDLDMVIKEIIRKPKPLALYIFTKKRAAEKQVLERVSFGGGCINDVLLHCGNSYLPFGGVGASGMGSYHGRQSFETFSHMKAVLKRNFNLKAMDVHPPYSQKQVGQVRMFLK